MAKKNVVEIVCDRCERTEYLDPDEMSMLAAELQLSFGMKPRPVVDGKPMTLGEGWQPEYEIGVTYSELCSSCKKTIRNLIEQITRKINWKRNRGDVEVEVDSETGG